MLRYLLLLSSSSLSPSCRPGWGLRAGVWRFGYTHTTPRRSMAGPPLSPGSGAVGSLTRTSLSHIQNPGIKHVSMGQFQSLRSLQSCGLGWCVHRKGRSDSCPSPGHGVGCCIHPAALGRRTLVCTQPVAGQSPLVPVRGCTQPRDNPRAQGSTTLSIK